MVRVRVAKEMIVKLVGELRQIGYNPSRAILFGSVAKSKAHALSDIDLALWDKRFTGSAAIDYEPIARILHRYPGLELHTFNSRESPRSNPFLKEITKTGIEIDLDLK